MNARHIPKFTYAPILPVGQIKPARRAHDNEPDNFDILRADLGRFWLVWLAAYTAIVIKASVLVMGWLIAWVQA